MAFPCTNASLSDVARILVPFSENKGMLIKKLEVMVECKLISYESKAIYIDKLVTYKELLTDLRNKTANPSVLSHFTGNN